MNRRMFLFSRRLSFCYLDVFVKISDLDPNTMALIKGFDMPTFTRKASDA